MDSVTLKVKDGYKNLRLRMNYNGETLLVLWNMDDDSNVGIKSFRIWNAIHYSKAGNYYIVVRLPKPLGDCQNRLLKGEEVELSECTIEARGNDIFLVDGWSDSEPKSEPPARHPAADRPNKDVVKIPKDIILEVKPLKSKWNLRLDRKEACNKYFTREDLTALENVDGIKVDIVGNELWIQYLRIPAGAPQPKITEDIYLDVKLGMITTKLAYNNYIVRIEAEDVAEIEQIPQEIERIDICGHSVGFSIAKTPKTASFSITLYNPKLDKSERGGLMQSFHGRCGYLSAGNTELYLEFQTDDQTINWSNVSALMFDCKSRNVVTVLGPHSLGADKLKFIEPPGSSALPYEPYSGQWYEPKTLMVSSSCFTNDDRQKLEDAMAQQVKMKRLLLNSRYGITTSPVDDWIRSGFDFDGDVVSIDKLREWTTGEDIERAEKDFNEFKAKQFINKRKGVKIMKKTDKTGPTVQEVFDTLTPVQRDTFYYLIGAAIEEHSKGGATMAMSQIKNVINEVIFDGPATVVMWADGTKTVVKAQHGDGVDREKGLALAMAKKFYGNDKNYFDKISMQVFGYNLRNLMKKRGMKAKDIAAAMKENKVTVPMVELWMRGKGKINANRITKLAKILGVKEEALFAAKDKKPSRPRTKKKTEE